MKSIYFFVYEQTIFVSKQVIYCTKNFSNQNTTFQQLFYNQLRRADARNMLHFKIFGRQTLQDNNDSLKLNFYKSKTKSDVKS